MSRALVVDDSRAVRMILTRILGELGWDVVGAGDGIEALALLDAGEEVDVALVDWNMPNMDGLELVKELRERDLPDLRVMMVTSESDLGRLVMAIEAGADEYAMKPFDAEVIREKLVLLGLGEV
ncbi:MAG TPA: response regulator [Acidimicrobiales bacterium]|nr:response regulator [Acidimicrobiales bacterium]